MHQNRLFRFILIRKFDQMVEVFCSFANSYIQFSSFQVLSATIEVFAFIPVSILPLLSGENPCFKTFLRF